MWVTRSTFDRNSTCESVRLSLVFVSPNVIWFWSATSIFMHSILGAAFTRFQTMRLQKVFPDVLAQQLISYGSCQFPTLGFVVARFKEVQAFVPEPFWKLKGKWVYFVKIFVKSVESKTYANKYVILSPCVFQFHTQPRTVVVISIGLDNKSSITMCVMLSTHDALRYVCSRHITPAFIKNGRFTS